MGSEKPVRRMTLRQLLTHAEKSVRDLIEFVHNDYLAKVADFRDLSRPVRRRSHYPTMLALHNSLRKVLEAGKHTQDMTESLVEQFEAIRDHSNRERVNRM